MILCMTRYIIIIQGKMKNKYPYILIFTSIFVVLFIIHNFFAIKPDQYMWDAWVYYKISNSLFMDGKFSLLTIENDFRGFVYPVYLFISNFLNYILNINTSFYVVSSFTLGILFTIYLYLFRKLFVEKEFNTKNIFIRSILVVLITVFFFYGLVVWPLTDLYAALISLIAGMLILYSKRKKRFKYILYFISGVLVYFAYNIRTIYQIEIIIILAFLIYFELKNKKLIGFINSVIFYCSGVLISSIPQIIINMSKYGTFSIWINNQNLFAQQLNWGLKFTKYSTYIGNPKSYPYPALCFIDATGLRITEQWEILGYPFTIKSYIKLFFQYPIEYIKIFIKHCVNAIFILFPELYVVNIDKNLLLYGLLSVAIVFTVLVLIFLSFKNKKVTILNFTFWIFMILPSLMILFGAVEERFLVLIYISIYSYICFFDYSSLKKYINRKNVILILVLFIIFSVLAFSIQSRILATLDEHPLYFIK